MDTFFKATGSVLVAIVLLSILGTQNKSFSSLLSIGTCVLILLLGGSFLEPIVDFLGELEALGQLPGEFVKILLKVTLICLLSEIAGLLCADSGNVSLGQTLKILSSCLILWLSVPVFRGLLDLVKTILEGV